MYALVNTMNGSDCYLGSIVSRHRSAEAAYKADQKLQDKVKRVHGNASYLPTSIVKLKSKVSGRIKHWQCDLVDCEGNLV